jgi:transcriptional/translational regulatory protein YebC/TACO1
LATQLTSLNPTVFGPDQASNPRLSLSITKAKRASCPKDAIDAALARGQGLSPTGTKLEAFTEEAMLPAHGVAVLVDCLSDSKGRTRLEMKNILKDNGASQASTAYLFSKRGHIRAKLEDGVGEDAVMECVIDAGALDVHVEEDGFELLTEVSDISKVCGRLKQDLDIDADEIDVIWVPNSQSELPMREEVEVPEVQEFLDELRNSSSVRGVYVSKLE